MKDILEGFAALALLVLVEFAAVAFAMLLADRFDVAIPPLIAIAGFAALAVWFCILYTVADRPWRAANLTRR